MRLVGWQPNAATRSVFTRDELAEMAEYEAALREEETT